LNVGTVNALLNSGARLGDVFPGISNGFHRGMAEAFPESANNG
jgi:hypothetical protein